MSDLAGRLPDRERVRPGSRRWSRARPQRSRVQRSRVQRSRVWLDGRHLHIRTGGPAHPTGPAVVVLPGLAMSGRYLVPTLTELAAHRRVIAPDLPGTGRSPHPPEPLTVTELADLVHRLLTATIDGPAVVVANSFGCPVAIELALRHPEAVRRLVLTSPAIAPKLRDLGPVAVRFLGAMRHEPPRYLALALLDATRAWTRKAWANLRAMLDYPIEQRAARLTVPTLVVRGRRDCVVPAEFAARLAAGIPDGSAVEVAGAHALPYDAPRSLARLILADGERPT